MELRKVGRTELGGINLDARALSRSLETKAFTPGNLNQKFLGSLEGRRIKARISRTRNTSGGVRNSDNHGFQNTIENGNE